MKADTTTMSKKCGKYRGSKLAATCGAALSVVALTAFIARQQIVDAVEPSTQITVVRRIIVLPAPTEPAPVVAAALAPEPAAEALAVDAASAEAAAAAPAAESAPVVQAPQPVTSTKGS
jgi:hypothetical protein